MTDDIRKALELANLDRFSAHVRLASDALTVHQPALDTAIAAMERDKALMRAVNGLPEFNFVDAHLLDIERCRLAFESATLPLALERFALMDHATALTHEAARRDAQMRAVYAPLADLRANGMLEALSGSLESARVAQGALSAYERNFDLPDFERISKLAREVTGATAYMDALRIDELAARMDVPWLDHTNAIGSFAAFAEVQHMGYALAHQSPFDDTLTAQLRVQLGDWRDPITLPDVLAGNIPARSAFYADLGLRRELTDFPAEAFDESLEIAGFRDEPPTLIELYGDPFPRSADAEEVAFVRTNRAYDWIMRFETHLRRFIDAVLTKEFGPDWPRHKLPNGLYDSWRKKQKDSEEAGKGGFPLICYADFTDYERVILKRDLWPLFSQFFRTEASARESLQRLYLPRIETMHGRAISQEDELYLYVELRRFDRVFAVLV